MDGWGKLCRDQELEQGLEVAEVGSGGVGCPGCSVQRHGHDGVRTGSEGPGGCTRLHHAQGKFEKVGVEL